MARVVRLGATQAEVVAQVNSGALLPGTVYVSIDGLLDGDEVIACVKDHLGGAVLRIGLKASRSDVAGLTALRDAAQGLSDNAATEAATRRHTASGFQEILDLADGGVLEK